MDIIEKIDNVLQERMMIEDEIKKVMKDLDKVMTLIKSEDAAKHKKIIRDIEERIHLNIPYGFDSKELKRLKDLAKKKYGFDVESVNHLEKLLSPRTK